MRLSTTSKHLPWNDAVANALVACGAPEETCMGIVPRGPGPHEFAAYVDLPLNVSDALVVAASSNCYPIDVGLINKKHVRAGLSPLHCLCPWSTALL